MAARPPALVKKHERNVIAADSRLKAGCCEIALQRPEKGRPVSESQGSHPMKKVALSALVIAASGAYVWSQAGAPDPMLSGADLQTGSITPQTSGRQRHHGRGAARRALRHARRPSGGAGSGSRVQPPAETQPLPPLPAPGEPSAPRSRRACRRSIRVSAAAPVAVAAAQPRDARYGACSGDGRLRQRSIAAPASALPSGRGNRADARPRVGALFSDGATGARRRQRLGPQRRHLMPARWSTPITA